MDRKLLDNEDLADEALFEIKRLYGDAPCFSWIVTAIDTVRPIIEKQVRDECAKTYSELTEDTGLVSLEIQDAIRKVNKDGA
jgi:hypothetical protein